MFTNMRNAITDESVSLLVDHQDAVEFLTKKYQLYKITDDDLRNRLLNPYVQTDRLVDEAVNLEQVVTQGYINLKEKSGR